jgi:hypothetical protein
MGAAPIRIRSTTGRVPDVSVDGVALDAENAKLFSLYDIAAITLRVLDAERLETVDPDVTTVPRAREDVSPCIYIRLFSDPSSTVSSVAVAAFATKPEVTKVPSVALNQELKFVLVIVATSAERVADVPVVAMYEVLNEPASSCALVTVPVTVTIREPAVGVNVRLTRFASPVPVPTRGPAVLTPVRVTVPVPVNESVYGVAVTVTVCVDSVAEFSRIFVLESSIRSPSDCRVLGSCVKRGVFVVAV